MDKLDKKMAIIGLGHIGKSFKEGLLKSGGAESSQLLTSNSSKNNLKVISQAEWVLISVKPLVVKDTLMDTREVIKNKLILSVATAVSIDSIHSYVDNQKQRIIRLMPNIVISQNSSVIGFYANKYVTSKEKEKVKKLLSLLGVVIDLKKEKDLDKLTVISACGPAIVAYFINLLSQSSQSLGLSEEISQKVALETFCGTMSYLKATNQAISELQESVATKGGITEQILLSLNDKKIVSLFEKSIKDGYSKVVQIQKDLGKEA